MTLKKLQKIFKQEFRPPFLPKGFVELKDVSDIYKEPALSITIGDRNVTVGEDGEIFGAGSNVGEAVKWRIMSIKNTKQDLRKTALEQNLTKKH